MSQKYVLEKKAKIVEEMRDLLKKYPVVGVASLHKVSSPLLQELRRKLKGKVYMRVVKNTLMKRALNGCGKPGIEKLEEYLKGSNIFMFTNMNPFKLQLLLDKTKITVVPKPGDVATSDIVVPAGNTGLPPGPIISELNAVGIPTRIESGSVWVVRDTIVARKGETISRELALALSRLNVKALEVSLSLKAAYADGIVIPEKELKLDLDATKNEISQAYIEAFNLSVNAAYPTSENITQILCKAHIEAFNLAFNASIPTKETLSLLLAKAYAEMINLSMVIAKVNEKAELKELTMGGGE